MSKNTIQFSNLSPINVKKDIEFLIPARTSYFIVENGVLKEVSKEDIYKDQLVIDSETGLEKYVVPEGYISGNKKITAQFKSIKDYK